MVEEPGQSLVASSKECDVDIYLLSPFEGRPMTSSRSTFIGFKRLHGPEGARPPRDDIEKGRGLGAGVDVVVDRVALHGAQGP